MSTKLGTLTLDLVAKIGSFTQGMKQASSSAEREMRRVENSVVTVDDLIKKLAVTAGAAFSISQLTSYADGYTDIVNRLKIVTNTQEELSIALKDTHKIAQTTASSWAAVNNVYSKYMGNAKILNLTQAESARLTEITSKAVAISGSTAQAAEGALFQYGQTLDGNILRAQEYNSLVDGAGGLLNAMAKGLNVTRGELRQMMLDGKLTGEVITKALLNAGNSVDDLYSKTATTTRSAANLIKNEATRIIGEFDNTVGASSKVVEAMTLVAENMDTVVIAGGALATVMIGRVASGYAASIMASVQQRSALNAEQAANVQLLATQMQKIKSQAGALAAERNLLIARIQQTTNLQQRIALEARATQVAIQLAVVEKQLATATITYSAAANAATASATRLGAAKAMLVRTGASLLGVMGGPVGLAVMLGTVAAGYLLTRDSTEETTKSLRENNESVEEAIQKYEKLDEVKRRAQLVSEKASLQELGEKYADLSTKLTAATYSFSRHNDMTTEQSKRINGLIAEYKKTGNIQDFSNRINALTFVSQKSKDQFNVLSGSVKDAGDEFKNQKSFVDQMSPSVKKVGDEAKKTATEVAGLTEELKKLLGVNADATNKSNYLNEMVGLKVDPKLAEMLFEARKAEGLIGTGKKLNDQVLKSVFDRWKADQGLNKTLEERAKIEEKNKKLLEAQGSALKINALVASNAAKANATALESAKNLPKGLLSAVNMVESPRSNFAKSGAGAGGPMQFMPPTADRYKVDINSVESSYRGASNYLKDLLKMFEGNLENALRAYNWGEGNMQNYLKYGSGMKPLGGNKFQKGFFPDRPMPKETREYSGKVMSYMGGASGVSFTENYSFDDWLKEQEQFAIEREKREKEMAAKQKEITLNVSTEEFRIRSKLADDIKNINESGFDDTETSRLIGEYQKRADIDIQIAQASHDDKLSIYSDYLKTEEVLTNESFARRQRDLKLDLTLSADEYTAASLALENQRKKEIENIRRDEKFEILESKRDWMTKGEYARDYYALVRDEILNTANYSPEMKTAMIQQAVSRQNIEESDERDSAVSDYRNMMGLEESPLLKQYELLDKMRELDLINEEKYQQDKLKLQALSTTSYLEGMFGGFASLVDENSKTYAVLFAAQKAFAVAQAMLNIPAAYSKAYDAVVGTPYIGPYIAPAVGAAAAALQVAQAANIRGVGFAEGGFTGFGGKYAVAGLVHKGEGVLTQEEIAAIGGPAGFYALRESIKNGFAGGGLAIDMPVIGQSTQNSNAPRYMEQGWLSNGGPQININVPQGYTAEQSRGTDGAVTIDIVEKRIKKAFGNMSNPNSYESKQVQRNFNTSVKR